MPPSLTFRCIFISCPLPPSARRGWAKNMLHFARGDWDALAPRGGDEPQEPVGARVEASSQLLRGEDAAEGAPPPESM